jgi:hypothetical protein
MAGGAETPNIAALPAIARLGACESARGPDADRHVKLLIQFAVERSLSGAYSRSTAVMSLPASSTKNCSHCWQGRLAFTTRPMADPYLVEMVIGDVQPQGPAPAVLARLTPDGCCFSPQPTAVHSGSPAHRALTVVAACYGAGVAIHRAVGNGIPNPPPDHLEIRYDDILPDREVLEEAFDLGEAHLAGAGTFGNGFLCVKFPPPSQSLATQARESGLRWQ